MKRFHTKHILFNTILGFVSGSMILLSSVNAATGLTYHGRITKPDSQPLESANVTFQIQLRSPGAENCLLFEEEQILDMTGSSGIFVITIGEGTRVAAAVDGGNSLERIFANRGIISGSPTLTCDSGITYSPGLTDQRKLQITFDDGSGVQVLPAQTINYVPLAIEAVQVSGYGKDQLLRVANGTTATEFSNANWTALWDLVTGASSLYLKADGSGFTPTASVDFNNQKIVDLADPTLAQDAVTKNYADTKVGGKTVDVSGVSAVAGNGRTLVWDQATDKWITGLINDATKVPLGGGTMTGLLVLSADPSAALGAASKQYVDAVAATTKASADANILGLPLTAPAAGQVGQSVRWNAAGTAWEYFTPSTSIAADSLNFTDLSDSLVLDASTNIEASGTNVLSITNLGTGNSLIVNDSAADASPFVIDAAGKVGIGVAAPTVELDVVGTVLASTFNQRIGGGGSVFTNTIAQYNNSNGVNYSASSVAAGSPDNLTLLITNSSSEVGKLSGLGFGGNGTASAYLGSVNMGGGLADIVIGRQTSATAYSEVIRIENNGNVGIGTTDPAAKLEVSGGAIAGTAFAVANANPLAVNFASGNTGIAAATSGTNIALSNMVVGGAYTLIIQDATSRTYDFTNGGAGSQCATATTRYVPANGATIASTHAVYTVLYAGAGLCYISWVTGF